MKKCVPTANAYFTTEYLNDEFLHRHFLDQYEQFVYKRRWSPEDHLLLTIGCYLNELGKKWKALEQMRVRRMALTGGIFWELVMESRNQILMKDDQLKTEREWKVEELYALRDRLHETMMYLLAEIDGGPFSSKAGVDVEKKEVGKVHNVTGVCQIEF